MIAGTHSGCGKTTVTCSILQALVNRKYKVSSFKCGPDYIDPMFHSKIIGTQLRNLDGFFCDRDTLCCLLQKNSLDISVIEGVMGFYDGVNDKASSYCLAKDTDTSVIITIDCKGMSLSIGAVMKGFLEFRKNNNIAGFIFNRLPESLVEKVKLLCREMNTEFFGYLPYCRECSIESRHLGLVTAGEVEDLKEKMKKLSELAEKHILINKIIELSEKSGSLKFTPPKIPKLSGNFPRIAVARDDAFCFYYEDNIELLKQIGCSIVQFSPLTDKRIPDNVSGLILGGGYPELYAGKLSANTSMLEDIYAKINRGLPTIAECGGFLYLHKYLEDDQKKRYKMVGIIDGTAFKTDRLRRFGYIYLTSQKDGMLCKKGERISAHEFHYWDSTSCGNGFNAVKVSSGVNYECVHFEDTLYAGFPHLYFYSNINAAVEFIKKCMEYKKKNEQN